MEDKVFRIKVDRTKQILASEALLASSWKERMVGLLNRTSLDQGQGLIIPTCSSVHTMFMRFPIDTVFVDDALTVLQTYECLPPWRITPIVWKANSVIELPAGTLRATPVTVGDRLVIERSLEKHLDTVRAE